MITPEERVAVLAWLNSTDDEKTWTAVMNTLAFFRRDQEKDQ